MMREYTKKEKLQNWLHYHKWWLAAGVALIWFAGYILWNILGIGQVRPDYQVAYVGSRRLPDETVSVLENALAAFGEDLNGDGKVAVSLTQHITGSEENMESMMYGSAAQVTLLADLSEGESTIFLLEDPVSFQQAFQILAHLDGGPPAGEDFEALDKVYRWENCPALASLDLGSYEDHYPDCTETGEIQDLMAGLYLGRRYFYIADQDEHPEANAAFWQALTEGATP